MDDTAILNIQYQMVFLTCKDLPLITIAAMNNIINFPEANPKQYSWYEDVAPLFTENDGTKMHQATRRAFEVYLESRLDEMV